MLFFAPFSIPTRILIPFGYFFLFEYGILARNYAIGVLLAFCICIVLQKTFKIKISLYYGLLFLLGNTHLLGLILAGAFHLYFILVAIDQKKKIAIVFVHCLAGAIILLPCLYFIFPPSDSEMNIDFWLSKWNKSSLVLTIQSPLRVFIPMPAWWQYHFWNTQFLLELHEKHSVLKLISPLISVMLLVLVSFILKK